MKLVDTTGNVFRISDWDNIIITDCDGVLTNGKVIYLDSGNRGREFSVRDGHTISELKKRRILTVVASGERDVNIYNRCRKLDIPFFYTPKKELLVAQLSDMFGLRLSVIAAIGDGLNDLDMLNMVGFAACPNDAHREVQKHCARRTGAVSSGYISPRNGGDHALEDIIQYIYVNFYSLGSPVFNQDTRSF